MKLTLKQIKEITTGAARVEEQDGAVRFYRFTKEQEELYKVTSENFYTKTFSAAGIKLSFKTDSKKMFLKVLTSPGSSRKYFSFDVFVDGKAIGYIDNFSDTALEKDYTKTQLPLGEFEKTFELGDGIKDVCVHFPWSMCAELSDISLDEGALVESVKQEKKLLAFGDSITHGYDALRPSNRYIAKLADALGAEEFNKGIGGERFFPDLAALKEDFVPDYITVAYGTNDWNKSDEGTFKENCKAFYTNLANNYPNSRIFSITPIWRKDMNEKRQFGDFEKIEAHIRHAVKDFENITVISGFDFVPKEENYFADLTLHPNDNGFEHYFENLYSEIKSFN